MTYEVELVELEKAKELYSMKPPEKVLVRWTDQSLLACSAHADRASGELLR